MKLILGHNQFIGISHISEDKAKEKKQRFSNVEHIFNVAKTASELGFKGMMLETHPKMIEFFEYYQDNKDFDIDFYLQVPFVRGYIQKMNEKGAKGLINEVISRVGLLRTSSLALKSGWNYLKKDYISLGTEFLKLEISPFTDVNIKALLLHNVITDLLLSLDVSEAFTTYTEFVEKKLQITPGFITLNFQLFQERCAKWHIKPAYIMSPINPSGYDMNPSKEVVEKAINRQNTEVIAMNILGGGAFTLNEAYQYLINLKNIKSCCVGASSKGHLEELVNIFTK